MEDGQAVDAHVSHDLRCRQRLNVPFGSNKRQPDTGPTDVMQADIRMALQLLNPDLLRLSLVSSALWHRDMTGASNELTVISRC